MSKDNPSSRNNSRRLIPIPGRIQVQNYYLENNAISGNSSWFIMVNPVQGLIPIKGFSLYWDWFLA
jgi:hypothetical protein